MDLEQQIAEALLAELQRQADEGALRIDSVGPAGVVNLQGALNLEAVAMAVVGAVAGGP